MNLERLERTYGLVPRKDAVSYIPDLRQRLYIGGFTPAWRRHDGVEPHVVVLARLGNTYELRVSHDAARATISVMDITEPGCEASDVALIEQYVRELLEGPERAPLAMVEM